MQISEGFLIGQRWKKLPLNIEFVQKLKSLVLILEKQWGMLFFLFYSLCQKLWGSSPIVNGVLNYIDSQSDTLEALESAASHSPSTVTDEVGLVDDYKKSQENADSSDDAADDEEVNSNLVSQSQEHPGREKWKPPFKIAEVKNSPHARFPSTKCFKLLKNT